MSPENERVPALAGAQAAFSRFLDVQLLSCSKDRLVAGLVIREESAIRNGVLHGGHRGRSTSVWQTTVHATRAEIVLYRAREAPA